ncbi:MAG: hypothetical protein RRZ83_03530 [Alistipes sp.]
MSKKHTNTTFGIDKTDSSDIKYTRIYFDLFKNDSRSLSEAQYNDLNLEELFNYLNRCITPVGEMLLYYKLRHIAKSNINAREKIVTQIEEDDNFREGIEDALSDLANDSECSTSSLLNLHISLSKWHRYFKFLPIAYLVLISIVWLFASQMTLLIVGLFIVLLNTFIHYWNKSYVETYIRPLGQLNRIRATAIKLIKIDQSNRLEDIHKSIDEISGLRKKVGIFNLNSLMESDFALVLTLAIDILKTISLIEPITTNAILTKISNIKFHTKTLIDYLGEWDVLYSIASLRVWMKHNNSEWSIPSFTASNCSLTATEMYHPLIADCVCNSITIDKSVIITGSNMSGKSSFLKTIGVNIVAAYAINTCFAEKIVLPNCCLHTVLSVSDDINNAQSYYYSEAQRIKSIIDKCNEAPLGCTNIVLVDEIFKGTNTIERLSIANAVIQYFTKLNNTIVIISTHDIELARSFKDVLSTYHFSETVNQTGLRFNYKLILGVEYTRNAISILKSCNYPEEIISCAELNTQKICKSMDTIIL